MIFTSSTAKSETKGNAQLSPPARNLKSGRVVGRPTPAQCPAGAGCRAVRDSTLVAWYRAIAHLAREGRMTVTIGRRELLAALGGAAEWPFAARAQQGERVRRALAQARTAQMTTTSDVTGPSSSISVITSADGGSIIQGAALTISWQTSNAPAGSAVSLFPQKAITEHVFDPIATALPTRGRHVWQIPIFVMQPIP